MKYKGKGKYIQYNKIQYKEIYLESSQQDSGEKIY